MIESYTHIAYMQPDAKYSGVFLVHKSSLRMTKKREPFLSVTLVDVTGKITGNIWNCSNIDIAKPGVYIHLDILTKKYKDILQFTAKGKSLQPFSGVPTNVEDYVRSPAESVLDYYAEELYTRLNEIEDADYRDMLHDQVDIIDTLRCAPFGEHGPLSHPGGLLIHTAHACRLALSTIDNCGDIEGLKLNKSLLILGCILRNIGWATTTILEGNHFRQRDSFLMTGVYRASARYVDHLMQAAESDKNITLKESKKQALHNLCSSIEDIRTLEGKVVAWSGDMAGILHFGGYTMNRKQEGNWKGDFFVGHLS